MQYDIDNEPVAKFSAVNDVKINIVAVHISIVIISFMSHLVHTKNVYKSVYKTLRNHHVAK